MVTVEQVLEVVAQANLVADVNQLQKDVALTEQGIDSLDFSGILFNLEEAFGVEIPDEVIDELKTLEQIVTYINQQQG